MMISRDSIDTSHARIVAPMVVLAGVQLAVLLAGPGCRNEVAYPNLGPIALEVHYYGTSQDRPLEEVRIHSALDNYQDATNLLEAPLQIGDATEIAPLGQGNYYVTVIRKQRPLPESPLVALTTAEPLHLVSGRYRLLVFDDSFRLLDPVDNHDASDL